MGWNVKFKVGDVVVDIDSGDVGIVTEVPQYNYIVHVDWKTGSDRGKVKWLDGGDLIHIQNYYP